MDSNYSDLAVQFGQLFGLAQGSSLKLAHLTKQGMEFVFENATTRTEVRLLPQVYTAGKVIVDAINDLTMQVRITQFDLSDGKVVGEGNLEMPFSTWFFEGDYM